MTTFRYLITAEDAGDQIQHFLRFKQGISRKVVISLKHLPEGILLNGSHARTIDLLREGDTLEINLPDQARKLPPCEIDVPRLYWDRDVAVFNKPAGMPVHQSGGHIFGTLASVYATLCEKEGNSGTFRAVNRSSRPPSNCRRQAVESRYKALCCRSKWCSAAPRRSHRPAVGTGDPARNEAYGFPRWGTRCNRV